MKNSPLKVSFILGVFITISTCNSLFSSYAMEESDNATPPHRISIRPIIQEGIEA